MNKDNTLLINFLPPTPSTGYPGNKANNGSYKQIINEFPPHEIFISGFLGACAVMKNKLPAPVESFGYELDPAVISAYWRSHELQDLKLTIECNDFIAWLKLTSGKLKPTTLIYADPPYLMESRKGTRKIYLHEMTTAQHVELLNLLLQCKCMVAISAYRNDLYDTMLKGWRVKEWNVSTHNGKAVECLYMNYAKPRELHQYNFLGDNKTQRQMIKRKRQGWINKLQNMTDQERYGLMEAINIYHGRK